jgi:hypothetical protein
VAEISVLFPKNPIWNLREVQPKLLRVEKYK